MRNCEGSVEAETPVAVFAHNRPSLLRRCLESLENNPRARNTPVIVKIDGPKLAGDRELIDACRGVCGEPWNFGSV